MKLKLIIAGVLLAVLVVASPVPALELLFPAPGTAVVNSDYLIIKGGTTPRLSGISVEINGVPSDIFNISTPEYRATFDDMLILAPEFDPGINTVRLSGYAPAADAGADDTVSKIGEVVAEIFYVDGIKYLSAPQEFPRFVMHTPAREAICQRCHNLNPAPRELNIPDAATNPCGACHARMLDVKHVHGPAGVFQCGGCHDPATRPQKYQVTKNDAQLCGECHQDMLDAIKGAKEQHGPLKLGMCTLCHDPHSSDYFAQLRLFPNDVCLNCHAKVAQNPHVTRNVGGKSHPLRGVPDFSRPDRELTCAGCHNPHFGANTNYFQDGHESRFALCGMCHQK
ncbi:MAG: cytochrome c3 family protein [Desulfuromonadales bacterium]|nr:cytochrome c3 family protein [Desulfuromonadales bacterium]